MPLKETLLLQKLLNQSSELPLPSTLPAGRCRLGFYSLVFYPCRLTL
jgi:hypothetical protein